MERTYPEMKGKGSQEALHEIHIFLSNLNPSEEELARYYEAVRQWNASNPNEQPMKACYLDLVFKQDGKDVDVCVMQSARYFRSDSTDLVIDQCHKDAAFFKSHGFEILREKIEANAHSIEGIPLTNEDVEKYPTKYFEFHIRVQRKNRDPSPITEAEIEYLKRVSDYLTHTLQTPVPLSFNKNKDKENTDGKGHQRFLNVRFRHTGLDLIKERLREISTLIDKTSGLKVVNSIDEYVWFDTLTSLDHGWIDFRPDESQKILDELASSLALNPFQLE